MIETILVLLVTFGGGFYVGHENPTVSCISASQVTENCIELTPLESDTFGATTTKLIEVVGQYRKCKAACEASK